MELIKGFSKKTKEEKLEWLIKNHNFADVETTRKTLLTYWHLDKKIQKIHDDFSENTLSNFYMPFGIAPNFLINGHLNTVPMVTEESSIVAAASKSANFWLTRGGFNAYVLNTEKVGQIHLMYYGDFSVLKKFFTNIKPLIIENAKPIYKNMEARGGGISDLKLIDKTPHLDGYFQLHCTFETLDAMGANFINSCLENFSKTLETQAESEGINLQIVMSILSNCVPNCLVHAEVKCPIKDLGEDFKMVKLYAEKFIQALEIAKIDSYRAVTHNKGIMNGVDAVILATGNDFRAVEAGVHSYACKNGSYSSLSYASIDNDIFKFWVDLPLALGTVGGVTSLHPLSKLSLEILNNPSAKQLMEIVAVAGLAQNFAAVNALITSGIQKGHMKMHLNNILNTMDITKTERNQLLNHFKKSNVSHSAIFNQLNTIRENK